jgi:DNA-binding CsgD family transcriptional regulator/tetratricopeptide (TPR) repeat protein
LCGRLAGETLDAMSATLNLTPLVGRERELAILRQRLDALGGALVLRGAPGIGKSALLAEAAARADQLGLRVLRAVGVRSEAQVPFAGLHQLLRPILGQVDALEPAERAALLAAIGMGQPEAPGFFRLAIAVLELVTQAAARTPVVMIADDAHWLDRSTWDVLAFVARRIAEEPVLLLAASRESEDAHLMAAGLPELRLPALGEEGARALLEQHADDLPVLLRERLLADAAGNPLALVELPVASRSLQEGALLPQWLPLTSRLERTFAARVGDLPELTRTLLLVAALDDGDALAEVLDAGALVAGGDVALGQLMPAVDAQLVELDELGVRFRHPLVRSAVRQSSSLAQRHAVHAAFATLLAGDPDRRVWHLAASSVGPDEAVALELEAAAERAVRRSGVDTAVAALEHAAALSQDAARRGRRLLDAAELAFQLGRREVVLRLLDEAEAEPLSAGDRQRAAWDRELFDGGPAGDAAGVRALTAAGERAGHEGDMARAADLLRRAGAKCWESPLDQARDGLVGALDRLGGMDADPRLVLVTALAATEARGAQVLAALARLPSDAGGDADLARHLGNAAGAVGDDAAALRFLDFAVERLRLENRLGLLVAALAQRAWSLVYAGRLDQAERDAAEGLALGRTTAQPMWATRAESAAALVAGLRGEQERARALADEAERLALPSRSGTPLGDVETARGIARLGVGDFAEAYRHLARLFDPSDAVSHPVKRWWVIGDVADAAARIGRHDEARRFLSDLEPVAARVPSPRLQAGMAHARAVLAGDEEAEARFLAALRPDGPHLPFAHARAQLAYGSWLRRNRRVAESRAHLTGARGAFAALGAVPWAERARDELRASGVTVRRGERERRDELTEQELQIARMAAAGLTNREIGQRLFLSHRTVGSHLYRAFPKLGITSRVQLRDALAADSASSFR